MRSDDNAKPNAVATAPEEEPRRNKRQSWPKTEERIRSRVRGEAIKPYWTEGWAAGAQGLPPETHPEQRRRRHPSELGPPRPSGEGW